ncbi:MAG TPA: FAD binding domain-containing protein [Gemmatimonadales bacterium]|nr:FAD binding domain-containing protein [Gemmatimonadales bacterium]
MFDQLRAFHRPTSVATALRLSESERRAGGRGTFVAGGTDVVVAGDRSLRWIVDLTKLPLRYVKRRGRGLAIGATSTFADLEASAAVRRLADGIVAEAAGTAGSRQIRAMGTAGGNLANASPAADLAPPFLALDAAVVIAGGGGGGGGRRTVPLDAFFRGPNRTVLNGGLLVEIVIPAAPAPRGGRAAWSFQKLGRLESDIAVVSAAAGVAVDAGGRCTWARLALGAVGPTPLRARRAEALLVGKPFDRAAAEAAAARAAEEAKPVTDVRGTAAYRREMSRVLVARALAECLERMGRTR